MGNLCPRCLIDLGRRKTALARHRKHCVFGEGTPWGSWQERLEWWVRREERTTSDAYANAARILFYRTMGQGKAAYVDILRKQLADDLESAATSHAHLSAALRETPASPLGPAESERLSGHRTTVLILASRIDELMQMKAYLEKTQ